MPDQPPPDSDAADYTPTTDDLRQIAEFLRQRSLNEAGAAGLMDFYQQNGVTIQVRIPKGAFADGTLDGHRQKVLGWLDEHSPTRFTDTAHQLANLADALADAGADAVHASRSDPIFSPYRVRAVWRALTSAARLWSEHPDFLPLWEDAKDD
ncbi:MAG: hypothetical protein HOV92_12700 [Streptomyces sp.]|nr:hypothetical protein [Streptomyces sp.]